MMSVDTQRSIIKDIQGFSGDELRKFLKSLIDVVFIGEDKESIECDIQDMKDCLDIITDTKPEKYHNLDTAVRDNVIDAYLKMFI